MLPVEPHVRLLLTADLDLCSVVNGAWCCYLQLLSELLCLHPALQQDLLTANAPVPLHLHFTGAAGIVLGILFAGWRLVPVAGMQNCLPKAYVCAMKSFLHYCHDHVCTHHTACTATA